jgi:hypothetical protein
VKLDWAFLRFVGLYAAVLTVVIVYPLADTVDAAAHRSIVAGAMMSVAHLLLGYLLVEWGFEKSNTTFLKIVLGGMVARLLLMAGTVFVLLKLFHYDPFSLMISLFLYYVINLGLEIYLLQKKVSVKHEGTP